MIKSQITDGYGKGTKATVTSIGQLVVAPYAYNEVKYLLLDTAAAGYTFFAPKAGQQFVLTGILLTADSNVVGSCIVDIYESVLAASATIGTSLFHFEILKNGRRDLSGLNILISEGAHVNAKTDDDDVFATLFYYYVPSPPL